MMRQIYIYSLRNVVVELVRRSATCIHWDQNETANEFYTLAQTAATFPIRVAQGHQFPPMLNVER